MTTSILVNCYEGFELRFSLYKISLCKELTQKKKKKKKNTSVGAFSGRIGLPPAVMGWAASCDDGP